VRIHAQAGGVVTGVYAAAGDLVQRDDPLLAIDQRIIAEQQTAARARLHLATTEHLRIQRLLAAEAATTQQATAAETEATAARAEVDRLHVLLGFHTVTAPISGRIADRLIEPGDLAAPGQPLFVLFDPDALRITAAIPAALSDRIAVGDPLPVTLDQPALSITGTVTEILGTIDPATRTRTVRIALPLPPGTGAPAPGTFARVWLSDATAERLTIPATALFRVGQLEMVHVLTEQDRAVRRLVRTGLREGDRVEILSGLRSGETIATTPLLATTP
jgi:RND family efflux transporter MFP subunit